MVHRDWNRKDVRDAFFPVNYKPVYYEARNGRMVALPEWKYIVDVEKDRPLSMVSGRYNLVTNKQSLDFADRVVRGVFGGFTISDFSLFNVLMPSTRASCRMDFIIENSFLEPFGDKKESYTPFLRVSNSYNRRSQLRFEVGFCRWICLNGCIFGQRGITLEFNHDQKIDWGKIDTELAAAKTRIGTIDTLWSDFQKQLYKLREIDIDKRDALPLFCKVFGIEIDSKKVYPKFFWDRMADKVESFNHVSREYYEELGMTAYALFNVFTDMASFPDNMAPSDARVHYLQKRVGDWVTEFTALDKTDIFSLNEYIGEDHYEAAKSLMKLCV